MEKNPCLKKVGDISGHFFVPAYQRGYRWGQHEVAALLNDIYLGGKRLENENYCLQPVVVKKRPQDSHLTDEDHECVPQLSEQFELIDGQQRLTTLYLLYHYLHVKLGLNVAPRFSLSYETRTRSGQYLRSLAPEEANDNIDFFHMYGAYQCVHEWFEGVAAQNADPREFIGYKIFGYLREQVRVIWYDAGGVDSTTLFTRLNVGRIALTNAELIKALVLAKHRGISGQDDLRQIEIATQWDMIERDLHRDDFWAFLTNKPAASYPTRIEFLFDLMANRIEGEKERFFTFLHFKQRLEQCGNDSKSVWAEVLGRFYVLREWFDDCDLYHKVGYLVTVGVGLRELVEAEKLQRTKTAFRNHLDERIRTALRLDAGAARELSYEADYAKCERLLLLFNVESVRRLEHSSERYPFHSHKSERWSLEHIHAQHSEQLVTEEQWRSWLSDSHLALSSLRLSSPEEEATKQRMLREIDDTLAGKVERIRFRQLANDVMLKFLHAAGLDDTIHSIANLALLSGRVNSALNNAAFQSKRLRVIELDRAGMFIPVCTRRVFFKYYTEAPGQQMHLWGREDQISYVDAMLSHEHGVGKYLQPAVASKQ